MKTILTRVLPAFFLFLACPAAPRAMEPWVLNQDLDFRYDYMTQGDRFDTQNETASYHATLSMPILTYRLGYLALDATLGYDHLRVGDRADGDFGLRSYGVYANLFPYRQFHLSLNYNHAESPVLFGQPRLNTDTYGLTYSYFNPRLPRVVFSAQRGTSTGYAEDDSWDQYSLELDRNRGDRYWKVRLDRFDIGVDGQNWWTNTLSAQLERPLPSNWHLRGFASGIQVAAGWSGQGTLTADGPAGPWYLSGGANLGASDSGGDGGSSRSFGLFQSATRTWNRWSGYASASQTFASVSGRSAAGDNLFGGTGSIGAALDVGGGWRVLGDVYAQWLSQSDAGRFGGAATGYHLGVSEGGDLPGVIRNSLFYVSDLAFSRRIAQEYPPGYVPPELALEMAARNVRQVGTQTFAADYYHQQTDNGGFRDWALVDGLIQVNHHMQLRIRGEWNRQALSDRTPERENRFVNLLLRYAFGRSALTASASYNQTSADRAPLIADASRDRSVLTWSLGFHSRLWKIPWGAYYFEYAPRDEPRTRTLSLYSSLQWGRLGVRLLLDTSRTSDGRRYSRISFNLVRDFASLLLFNGRPRA